MRTQRALVVWQKCDEDSYDWLWSVVMPAPSSHDRQDLLDQLHRANEHLHASREEWEHWLNATEYRHQERVGAAWEHLREAEREIEAIEQRIGQVLTDTPPTASS